MSQDDEESNKYKLNNNQHNYNNSYHDQTLKKTENNQQVMPIYENCTLYNNNNNSGYKKPDYSTTVEQALNKSGTFNNDYLFVRNTTNAADVNEEQQEAREFYCIGPEDEYENISYGIKENYDKKILLQKYFRSALVGPRSNIYENLCRGCNYGVFNARGPLCTFCECIVNGVSALRSDDSETSITTSNNIYENICEHCSALYSGVNCSKCHCQKLKESEKSKENDTRVGSEELLIEKIEKEKKNVKVNKSKSFNKSNKPKIFTNFWDTIRKPKNHTSGSVNRKPLEIVHHVEGFDQVFHTKDTFDLQKICELKRSGTSCSDQHIYGRLKQNDLNLSQEVFNSTQSLTQSANNLGGGSIKKPRISKAKFLRTQPSVSASSSEVITTTVKAELSNTTLYLNSSPCQWMTSLRHEIHDYNTFMISGNEIDQETLCYPKSIPSKNVLNSCKAPVAVNHMKNLLNLKNLTQLSPPDNTAVDLTQIESLVIQNFMTSTDSWKIDQTEKEEKILDYYQLLVEDFIANIINRQMLKTKESKQQIDNVKAVSSVNNNDSYSNNNDSTDITLRQANLTCTTTTTTTMTTNINNNTNNHRYKRQGMYLRLEDHPQLQQHNGSEQMIMHNNKLRKNIHSCTKQGERVEMLTENINNECDNLNSLVKTNAEHNTVNTLDTGLPSLEDDLPPVSRCLEPNGSDWDLIKIDKRRGIHERHVLEAFEALLAQEATKQLTPTHIDHSLGKKRIEEVAAQKSHDECNQIITYSDKTPIKKQTFADKSLYLLEFFPTQMVDVTQLINQQQLSAGLNTVIICYDNCLKVFLHYIYQINKNTRTTVYKIPNKQFVRKFKQFYNYCEKNTTTIATTTTKPKTTMNKLTCVSSNLKLDLNVTYGWNSAQKALADNESLIRNANTANGLKKDNFTSNLSRADIKYPEKQNQKVKTPPQVPKRDPKTKLSPTSEIKQIFPHKMTVPANNQKTETKPVINKEEESIYQRIWKFETRGKVAERYQTDDDYYDLEVLKEKIQLESPNSDIPKILISDDILTEEEEDHNNWEPDEEFVFTKQMKKQRSSSLTSDRTSIIRSNHSSNSSLITSSSLSGSTITEFASSTATLASTVSSSLKHFLFRNIGIFYSLTEPKLRAIIYDYDRIHSSMYFAKPMPRSVTINDSGFGKSLSPLQSSKVKNYTKKSSSTSSPATSSTSSPVSLSKRKASPKTITSLSESDIFAGTKVKVSMTPPTKLIPSSVQAWKYLLLDVNYMEDEEDMIVSECEILRAQEIKEDIDQSPPTQPQQFMQRFKSRSTENFLDIPNEDDKKTIVERLANMYTRFSPKNLGSIDQLPIKISPNNKFQRGFLNINGRNSPKSEKKAYKLHRASQSTSLYLEDGLKPKYPIFAAQLDQLELQQNVPRFVVDAVDYIERKDRIIQDGIYRACGNKFSIDELKQKLTKSYIYDSKLIAADDIHTVTSLLKQFFRDLPEPIIPQDIYNRITTNLNHKQSTDTIRIAIEEMKEPNKSTLRFLIKHLTNVAACSSSNRMNASNVAIVWGPSLFAQNDTYDMIGRMNTLTKVLIENYDRIFDTNERLL